MENATPSLLLAGRGPQATLVALALQQAELAFTWVYDPAVAPPAAWVPELALLPGPALNLSLQSLALWQGLHEALAAEAEPLTTTRPFYDLATTPGRGAALQQEATLDALAGAPVTFDAAPLRGLQPALVLGQRSHPAAPWLQADTPARLEAAVGRSPTEASLALTGRGLDVEGTLFNGQALVAEDALLAKLWPALGLQPRRRHRWVWQVAAAPVAPVAPCVLLQRMPKGHVWAELTDTQLVVDYDGVADPRQATADATPDAVLGATLQGYLAQLAPGWRQVLAAAPEARTMTDWMLPDGLPYLGAHPAIPGVRLVGGAGARAGMFAPVLAERLLDMVLSERAGPEAFQPGRTQPAQPVVPESLCFEEPTETEASAADAPAQAAPMLTETADVQRASEVRMVGKQIEGRQVTMQERARKPKVQTASIRQT